MFVGTAGTNYGRFRTALNTGSYGLARNIAAGLPRVDLRDAIRLTLLAADRDNDHFDALALRCLVRLIEERYLTLNDVLWAVQRFQDVREGLDGETGLLNLLQQKRPRTAI
jgi:hypothetical protein